MRSLLFVLLLGALPALGQLAEPVYFHDKLFDFGNIDEQDGPVTHEFTFVNQSGRPVKIVSVQASCGCTTPDWSKEPVGNGRTGFIRAQFDPKGRPGYFNKTLTVITDYEATPIVLQIKGNVTMPNQQPVFSEKRGGLMFPTRTINFGKLYVNQPPTAYEYRVVNTGELPVKIYRAEVPGYMTVNAPEFLMPDVPAVIKLTYDARARNMYGFTSDNIILITSDKPDSVKSISVYATLEEFFPRLSPEEEKLAPRLGLPLAELDFGRVRAGSSPVRELPVRNLGKKELIIRAVQGNCDCLKPSMTKTRLKPGEDSKVRIVLDATGLSGTQEKAVTIYSTDPLTPVMRIMIKAYVEN